jgi:hypothetical protein
MERCKITRFLRIAASAGCLAICVTSAVLWARSYTWNDWLYLKHVVYLDFQSFRGVQAFVVTTNRWKNGPWQWKFSSIEIPFRTDYGKVEFRWIRGPQYCELHVPHWVTTAISGVLAAALWIPWSRRFSLRALLIAFTLVAMVLGLVVAMRGW